MAQTKPTIIMKNSNLNIAKHYQALVIAEQKLNLLKTIKVAFAWESLNRNDPDGFFETIITYLQEVKASKEMPQDLKAWAQKLQVSYQIEFSIFYKSQTIN
jgi:hypothetical protein